MHLHPQARQLLDALAAAGRPPIWQSSVAEGRAGWEALSAIAGPGPELASVSDIEVQGATGPIGARHYRPTGDAVLPVLVWIHGGGFVIGSLPSYDHVCRTLAERSGCAVISLDYRLAPEHPFPAGVEDCIAAVSWIAEHADELGIDADRLAVGGDSAGGNLACVVTLAARDKSGPDIAFQLLVYPGTDLGRDAPSMTENASGYLLESNSLDWFVAHYLGDAELVDVIDDWRASPIRAGDHAGLPPALVITAGFDPIRDFGERYAERLRGSGVAVELHRYEGMVHGFLSLPTVLDDGDAALTESAEALAKALR